MKHIVKFQIVSIFLDINSYLFLPVLCRQSVTGWYNLLSSW